MHIYGEPYMPTRSLNIMPNTTSVTQW